jgi:hypothetical protein
VVDSDGVHPTRLAMSYLKQWNPVSWSDPSFKLSKALAYHDAAYHENLRQELGAIGTKGGDLARAVVHVAFAAHEFVHKFTAHVVFRAAFEQFKAEGADEIEAAQRADAVVERNFPNGDIAEKPPILRTKYGVAAAVMFYGYASKIHNVRLRAIDDWVRGACSRPGQRAHSLLYVDGELQACGWRSAPSRRSAATWPGAGPPATTMLRTGPAKRWCSRRSTTSRLSGQPAKKLLTGHKVNIASVPAVDLLESNMNKLGAAYEKAKKGGKHDESKALAIAEAFVEAMGPTLGPKKAFGYMQAVATKKERPRNPFDVGAGLIYGKAKNPKKDSRNPLTDLGDLVDGRRRR